MRSEISDQSCAQAGPASDCATPMKSPPSNHPTAIEGLKVSLPTISSAIAMVASRLGAGKGFTLFTLNLDHLVKLRSEGAFRDAYHRATHITADGWPVVWLAGRDGAEVERVCGADLVEPLCALAAERNSGIYFIGPGPRAAARAAEILQGRYRGLQVAGLESPQVSPVPTAEEIAGLARRLAGSGAKLCFVSLGAPKQELVADALIRRCPDVGFVCVGAALDFIAGESRRAPVWMRRFKLEWFWRLASEPRRLTVRYAKCAFVFLILALAVSASSGGAPGAGGEKG